MEKIFKSRVDWFFKGVMIFLPVIMLSGAYFMSIDPKVKTHELFTFIGVFALIYSLILLLAFLTDYKIKNRVLYCRSGIFKKELEISSIRKIEKSAKLYVGWKLGLALKGIVIHYNKFDDLYISPLDEKEFINTLLEINPEIQIIEKK